MTSRRWLVIAAVCAVLVAMELGLLRYIPGYSALRDAFPYYIGQSYRSFAEVVIVLAIAAAVLRGSGQSLFSVVGLNAAPWNGLKAAALMVLPLYAVFAFAFSIAEMVPVEVLYLAFISPFAEELVYRGFAFGMLRKVAGWGFWPAALLPAAFFAWGHLDQANDVASIVMTVVLVGGGAILFSWLFEKWNGLWVPLALHVTMNFAWNLFAVGDGAFAGTLPTIMQLTTVVAALAITAFRQRIGLLRP